jgi:hypothetical protein
MITVRALALRINSSMLGVTAVTWLSSLPSGLWRQKPHFVDFPFSHQLGELPQLATAVTSEFGSDSRREVKVWPKIPTECESPTKSILCVSWYGVLGTAWAFAAKTTTEHSAKANEDIEDRTAGLRNIFITDT